LNATSRQNPDKFLVPYFNRPCPINWDKEFGRKAPIVVEIGFGIGEYLLRCAEQNPGKDFIGIEINFALIKKVIKRLCVAKIANVRLLKAHAAIAFEYLFALKTISHIDSLFSFPWPKKRHHRHRLFQTDFLRLVNSRLVPGGILRIVTDDEAYFHWILKQNQGAGFKSTKKTISAQFNTRFERKWQAEGQRCFFQVELEKKTHVRIPVKKAQSIPSLLVPRFGVENYAPRSLTGTESIIFKKFTFDGKKQKGCQIVLTAEGPLIQRFIVWIKRSARGWVADIDQNARILRTKLVKKSLARIAKACRKIRS